MHIFITKKILAIGILLFFSISINAHALEVTVKREGNANFSTITAAVDYLRSNAVTEPITFPGTYAIPAEGLFVLGNGTSWLTDITVGDAFSFDGQVWFGVSEILTDTNIVLDRPHNLPYGIMQQNYTVIKPHLVTLLPGAYIEEVSLQGLDFIRFRGTANREAVSISGPGSTIRPINNMPVNGYVSFENISIRSPFGGVQFSGGGGNQLTLKLKNVLLDTYKGADNIFAIKTGALMIDNSLILGAVDGITTGALNKYFSLTNSRVYMRWNSGQLMGFGGRAIRLSISENSLIKNSTIAIDMGTGSGEALILNSSNSASLSIIDSQISAITEGTTQFHLGALGLQMRSGSTVYMINSQISTTSPINRSFNITLGTSSVLNLFCSNITKIFNNGGIVNSSCNQ